MDDLIRFVWRGAVGGLIVPLLLYTFLIFPFGPALVFYLLFVSFWLVIPGALVGLTLWFVCTRFVDRLEVIFRMMIGMAVVSTILALVWLYSIFSSRSDLVDFPQLILDLPRLIFWLLFNGASIGLLAGWLCPSTAVFRKEPELSYRERVRQYEEAQAEHEYWKAKLESGQSPPLRRST